MFSLVFRAIIIYSIVLFAVRLMGKRQIGDMQPFELVITLIIADLACIPMSDISIPIVFGVIPLFCLVILHHFFSFLNRKSIFFRKLLNGRPIIVIDKNGINYLALKKMNMTLNDLTEGLRTAECFSINDVAYAIVETNGNISVLLKTEVQAPTAKNMKVKTDPSTLNVILVNDGKMLKENLNYLKLDEEFITDVMKEENTKKMTDVLIFSINNQGEIYYQEKNKPYKILKKNLEFNI